MTIVPNKKSSYHHRHRSSMTNDRNVYGLSSNLVLTTVRRDDRQHSDMKINQIATELNRPLDPVNSSVNDIRATRKDQ